jgi:hypothetical protein
MALERQQKKTGDGGEGQSSWLVTHWQNVIETSSSLYQKN